MSDDRKVGFAVELLEGRRVRIVARNGDLILPAATEDEPIAVSLPDLDAAQALRDVLTSFLAFHQKRN